ncbi:MAG TPA: tyrosine-type recombinase/integrase [Candidatus Acidoferrales bacterium]|nr:tyrosine-type recombinase/integrase [Candidatus Acidoferrales bacterium]
MSEDQVRRLLSGIRNPVHKTCLAVMYACGLRISEATTLEVGAIDRANQVLRIVGKGDKERLPSVPMTVRHQTPGNLDLRARKDNDAHAHAPATDRYRGRRRHERRP